MISKLFNVRITNAFLAILTSVVCISFFDNYEFFQADVLYIPTIIEDIDRAISLSKWNFSPSPYFFPDMIFYFVVHSLFNSHSLSIVFFGIIQASITIYLFLTILNHEFIVLKSIIISISIIAISYYFSPTVYLFIPGMHTSAFLFSLLVLFLFINKRSILLKYILLIIYPLIIASDRLILLLILIPFLSAFIFYKILLYFNRIEKNNEISEIQRYLFIGTAIGLVLFGLLKNLLSIQEPGKFPSSLSISLFLSDVTDELLSSYNFILIILLINAFIILLKIATILNNRNHSNDNFEVIKSILILFYIFIPPFCAVIYGSYAAMYSIRYFLGNLIFSFVIFISYIYDRVNFQKFFERTFGYFSFRHYAIILVMYSIIIITIVVKMNLYHEKKISYTENHNPKLVSCVDRIVAEKNLGNNQLILSDYWTSRAFYIFSETKLISYHIDYFSALPSKVLMNANLWDIKEKPDFIFMQNLPDSQVKKVYGIPDEVFECPLVKNHIITNHHSPDHAYLYYWKPQENK